MRTRRIASTATAALLVLGVAACDDGDDTMEVTDDSEEMDDEMTDDMEDEDMEDEQG